MPPHPHPTGPAVQAQIAQDGPLHPRRMGRAAGAIDGDGAAARVGVEVIGRFHPRAEGDVEIVQPDPGRQVVLGRRQPKRTAAGLIHAQHRQSAAADQAATAAPQYQGVADSIGARRQQHQGMGVEGALERGGVIGHAIATGAEIESRHGFRQLVLDVPLHSAHPAGLEAAAVLSEGS